MSLTTGIELKEMNKERLVNRFIILIPSFFYLDMPRHTFIHHTDKPKVLHKAMLKGKVPSIPNHNTISRRINRLDIKIKDTTDSKEFQDEYIVVSIDSTGIKVTNRGQWMRDKWNVKKKRYLKIHIAVNVKTKKILSMKVTDEHVHDSKALPELIDNVIESDKKKQFGKLFADGAYDGNEIFRNLADNGIQPCIKVRKNTRIRWKKGNVLRNLSVLAQKKDLQKNGKTA